MYARAPRGVVKNENHRLKVANEAAIAAISLASTLSQSMLLSSCKKPKLKPGFIINSIPS